jgi:hypothetical protein
MMSGGFMGRCSRRLLSVTLLASAAVTVGGCGSGGDCIDALRFDGMTYAELADDPSFESNSAEANGMVSVAIELLQTLAMVVEATDGCETGDHDAAGPTRSRPGRWSTSRAEPALNGTRR